MRSHRRRLPLEHVLVAGGVADLPGIMAALAWLPSDAYGQVLVEADVDVDLSALHAPLRVTVQRVAPTDRLGEALGQAVAGWVAEWIPDEPDPKRDVTVCIGAGVQVHCVEIAGLAEPL